MVEQKDFVREWVEAETKAYAQCPVVNAIARHTDKSELDEAKLLVALKTMAKQEAEEDV